MSTERLVSHVQWCESLQYGLSFMSIGLRTVTEVVKSILARVSCYSVVASSLRSDNLMVSATLCCLVTCWCSSHQCVIWSYPNGVPQVSTAVALWLWSVLHRNTLIIVVTLCRMVNDCGQVPLWFPSFIQPLDDLFNSCLFVHITGVKCLLHFQFVLVCFRIVFYFVCGATVIVRCQLISMMLVCSLLQFCIYFAQTNAGSLSHLSIT